MNDIQKEINEAFTLASALPVSGDSVEIMAAVREHLRRAYKLAADRPEEGAADG